jgi:putative FmdB family regulatory protein
VPLYEYQCATDGVFELVRKFSDPPLAACPTCGGPVEKLMSAPAIQFKGTGWYITDYARKSGGDKAGKEGDKGGKEKSSSTETKSGDTSASKDSSAGSSNSSASSSSTSSGSTSGGSSGGGEKK